MTDQNTNNPKLTNRKMDYLHSISPSTHHSQNNPASPSPILSKKNKILLLVLTAIAIALIVVVSLTNRNYVSPNEFSPNYGAIPVEIIDDYKINIESLDFSSAIAVSAMSASTLNFHLDQPDTIVAIVEPSGISALDRKSDTVFIYASIPPENSYVGFFPTDFNPDGTNKDSWLLPEQTAIYFSKTELFDQLTSSAKFYIINKE